VYLYDNKLDNIHGLRICHGITRLFLQDNQIERLEGFNELINLQYLNLRGNKIQFVDGLVNLKVLETLHLDKQKLDGQPIVFDEECFQSLGDCLRVFTCTENQIHDLRTLQYLHSVRELDLSACEISNSDDLCETITTLINLHTVTVKCDSLKDRYLRQKLIRANNSLECINGKDVSEFEREFTTKLGKLKKAPKTSSAEITTPAKPKLIPHLPPYATQYRYSHLT
jgi:protein phosphatase 1 regulatory subunit 42